MFNDSAITDDADGAANEVYLQSTQTAYLKIGSFITNSCLTAFGPFFDADDANRGIIAGFNMSVSSCVDHALDGFTVWGHPLLYVVGSATANFIDRLTRDHGTSQAAAGTDYVLTNAELDAANTQIPWGLENANGRYGDPHYVDGGLLQAMNMGQVRAFVPYLSTGTDSHICFVFTSSEYFSPSAMLCIDGDKGGRLVAADMSFADTANEGLGGLLDKAYYGSIWNAWAYKENETNASTYLRAQISDHCMIVGTFQGQGSVGRMKFENAPTDVALNIDTSSTLTTETTNITTKLAEAAN